ncbi:hypothetical protein [Brumimicrobium aurantiacum]|nr:hypothetical protein [Brumimicrobium aurantiacum]
MKIKSILATALMMVSLTTMAQIKKGTVSYDVYMSSDDPNVSAYVDQMGESTLDIHFTEFNIRTDLIMGSFMTNSTISEIDYDTSLVLMDGMMGKIAMKVTDEDMSDDQRAAFENVDVELVDETKEIMGYTCKKAYVTTEDENESVVWYTEEILPVYRKGQFLSEEIPGLPLEMEAKNGKMNMRMVAYKFKSKIKNEKEIFSLEVPEGFKIYTPEELKKMGMGGR